MAKDMYQKRKERKEKKQTDNVESVSKTNINWLITIYLTLIRNPLFIRTWEK